LLISLLREGHNGGGKADEEHNGEEGCADKSLHGLVLSISLCVPVLRGWFLGFSTTAASLETGQAQALGRENDGCIHFWMLAPAELHQARHSPYIPHTFLWQPRETKQRNALRMQQAENHRRISKTRQKCAEGMRIRKPGHRVQESTRCVTVMVFPAARQEARQEAATADPGRAAPAPGPRAATEIFILEAPPGLVNPSEQRRSEAVRD
jgi:hypothetical protein